MRYLCAWVSAAPTAPFPGDRLLQIPDIERRYLNRSIFSGFAQKFSLISVRFLRSSRGSLRNGRNLGKTGILGENGKRKFNGGNGPEKKDSTS